MESTLCLPGAGESRGLMDPTRISALIDCRGGDTGCDATVESVIAHAPADVEIVILDSVLEGPAGRDVSAGLRLRARIVPADGLDSAVAKNRALELITGDLVCGLAPGVVIAAGYFERALALFACEQSPAFVLAGQEIAGQGTGVQESRPLDVIELLRGALASSGSLVRTSALRAVGGYARNLPVQGWEDWDLWITLAERGFTGAVIPGALAPSIADSAPRPGGRRSAQAQTSMLVHLFRKHERLYRAHLAAQIQAIAQESAGLERRNLDLARDIGGWRSPSLAARSGGTGRTSEQGLRALSLVPSNGGNPRRRRRWEIPSHGNPGSSSARAASWDWSGHR